jgi:hypothetical protein
MPPRRHRYDEALRLAPWVERLDNSCLREMVTEALIARKAAVTARGNAAVIASGDKTLERIEFGKDTGDVACRKASVAIRRFDEAYMATRTAGRRGRALAKRYGHSAVMKRYHAADVLAGAYRGRGRGRNTMPGRPTAPRRASGVRLGSRS